MNHRRQLEWQRERPRENDTWRTRNPQRSDWDRNNPENSTWERSLPVISQSTGEEVLFPFAEVQCYLRFPKNVNLKQNNSGKNVIHFYYHAGTPPIADFFDLWFFENPTDRSQYQNRLTENIPEYEFDPDIAWGTEKEERARLTIYDLLVGEQRTLYPRIVLLHKD